jgi:hypothetical protein
LEEDELSSAKIGLAGSMNKESKEKTINTPYGDLINLHMVFTSVSLNAGPTVLKNF